MFVAWVDAGLLLGYSEQSTLEKGASVVARNRNNPLALAV